MSKAPQKTKPIADRVREFRAAKAWTQEDLAANSGVSVPTIQRVEAGKHVSAETIASLAAAFAIPAPQLSGQSPGEPASTPAEADYLPLCAIETARALLEFLAEAKVVEFDYDDLPNEEIAETMEVFYQFCKARLGCSIPESPKEHYRATGEAAQQLSAIREKRISVAGSTYNRTCYELDDFGDGSIPILMAKWEETCLLLRFGLDGTVPVRAYINYGRQPKYSNIDDPKVVRAKKPETEADGKIEDDIPF